MRKFVLSAILGTALVAVTAAPAAAQGRFELGVGPTFQNWGGSSNGWAIDFGYTFLERDSVAVAAIFDYSRNVFGPPFQGAPNEEVDTAWTVGARAKFLRDKRVGVFVQGVFGRMGWDQTFPFPASGTNPMFGAGGGAQIRITQLLDAKAQVDLYAIDGDLVTRVFLAAVVKFGG